MNCEVASSTVIACDALYPTLNEHPVSKRHNPLNCISIDVTNTTSLVESHENCAQRDASINVPVFLLSNVMSLVPKIDEVRIVANSVNPDFISVTETWLQNHVHSNIVELNGYNIARKDRQRAHMEASACILETLFSSLCWKLCQTQFLKSCGSECVRLDYRGALIQL